MCWLYCAGFQGGDLEAGIKGVSWYTDEGHRLKRLHLCQLLIKLTEEPLASCGHLFFFLSVNLKLFTVSSAEQPASLPH